MKLSKLGYLALVIIVGMVVNGISLASSHAEEEYSFKVHNTTKVTIKKILVSEDKKTWGHFDVGRNGIKAGETTTLAWDKSTNNEECSQWVKALFADGEESEPAKFDFCESDLELEF
jgi:hypothetical protein